MIYIVKGQAGGGTSATMRVMIFGGIDGNYHEHRNENALRVLNNPHGCFESRYLKTKEFFHLMENKVTKIMGWRFVEELSPEPMKIVWVKRKVEDVTASRNRRRMRATKNSNSVSKEQIKLRTEINEKRFYETIKDKPNVEVLEINFEDLLSDTRTVVEKIAEFVAPHPFDIENAIKAIDKTLDHGG